MRVCTYLPRCELRSFFGSHTRTLHVNFKVRTCAHIQFEVVALCTRNRTFGKVTFFQHFFSKFSVCFQQFSGCSRTGKDVLKQERTFYNGIGCSRIAFFSNFVPKVCKSTVAHRTPKNEPHARTSCTLFRLDFARTFATHTLVALLLVNVQKYWKN